jgi:hypothetical protein
MSIFAPRIIPSLTSKKVILGIDGRTFSEFQFLEWELSIQKIINSYKNTSDERAKDIIETFKFIKRKIPIYNPNKPKALNNILRNYLILIKKLTLATKLL